MFNVSEIFIPFSKISVIYKIFIFLDWVEIDARNVIVLENLENLQVLIFEQVHSLTRLDPPAHLLFEYWSWFWFVWIPECLVKVVRNSPVLSLLNVDTDGKNVPLDIIYKLITIAVSRNHYAVLGQYKYGAFHVKQAATHKKIFSSQIQI